MGEPLLSAAPAIILKVKWTEMTGVGTILYFIAASITIVYLILRPKKKFNPVPDRTNPVYLADIKANSDHYVVLLENSEFKDSSYLMEVEQDNSDYQLAAQLAGGRIGAYYTPVEPIETLQSVLFYKVDIHGQSKRYCQTFPMDQITLKYHVMMGDVVLYVNKEDPGKYFFDIIIKE